MLRGEDRSAHTPNNCCETQVGSNQHHLPTSEIERLAHELAAQFSLDRERAIAMAMLAPLCRELATLKMPSENGEHVAAWHEWHTRYTRTLRAHCKLLIL
jgi:hypothetical protein